MHTYQDTINRVIQDSGNPALWAKTWVDGALEMSDFYFMPTEFPHAIGDYAAETLPLLPALKNKVIDLIQADPRWQRLCAYQDKFYPPVDSRDALAAWLNTRKYPEVPHE